MDYVLKHHGILGQKWGVRRYQNMDGSLTDAGRRRYGQSSFVGRQYRKAAKRNEIGANIHDKFASGAEKIGAKGLAKNARTVAGMKRTVAKEQIRRAENAENKAANRAEQKSMNSGYTKHYRNLRQKYMDQGMSKADAERAATKRVKTEQAVKRAAGLTLAAAAAYGAYRNRAVISRNIKALPTLGLPSSGGGSLPMPGLPSPGRTRALPAGRATRALPGPTTALTTTAGAGVERYSSYRPGGSRTRTIVDLKSNRRRNAERAAGAAALATAGVSAATARRVVSNYKKEHPNTELSDAEILRNYASSKAKNVSSRVRRG